MNLNAKGSLTRAHTHTCGAARGLRDTDEHIHASRTYVYKRAARLATAQPNRAGPRKKPGARFRRGWLFGYYARSPRSLSLYSVFSWITVLRRWETGNTVTCTPDTHRRACIRTSSRFESGTRLLLLIARFLRRIRDDRRRGILSPSCEIRSDGREWCALCRWLSSGVKNRNEREERHDEGRCCRREYLVSWCFFSPCKVSLFLISLLHVAAP